MSELTAHFDLPQHRGAPGAARHAVRAVLAAWGYDDPQWLDQALVVVSELVSNAIRHGGGATVVDLQAHDGTVAVGVTDGSAAPPHRRAAAVDDPGGRGLAIVEALTQRWGVQEHHGGKRVWARLLPHPEPAPP